MTEERLSRANELSNLIRDYKNVIDRFCNGMSVNENRLGGALIDLNKYAPHETDNIKSAITKAFDSIQKEFDEL